MYVNNLKSGASIDVLHNALQSRRQP